LYQAYIVDDEPLMVRGIIKTAPWAENGFAVAGSACDPVKGAKEILAAQPDVVFCDLRMPKMDGLAMMKYLREAGAGCEFVMLSAFGEFEATREFFRMEGFDYLLKPLQVPEADMVLEKVARKLAQKRNVISSIAFSPSQNKSFDDLVTYVLDNFNQKHTLASLSKRFGLSASYICNLFAKHYGSTLTVFLTDVRMREAVRMMRESDEQLKVIAICCGYSDYFYFCRVFKQYYGLSPTEYRQQDAQRVNA
jgi:YesN/AraC family two-component response regulator